ncbi:hypothetical protein Barb6XT_01838 [Bacteroidales bacterium Barb6XT]|nr:hypothetical protein Barb6XT_01838 [Bacteroidales bacterium Barb6XT]
MEKAEVVEEESQNNGIVTTEEELEGFYIVKSILRPHIDPKRITYRDAVSYFTILVDDNNRKLVCRLYFNTPSKKISFFDNDKKENKCKLNHLDDIYSYSQELIGGIAKYAEGNNQ